MRNVNWVPWAALAAVLFVVPRAAAQEADADFVARVAAGWAKLVEYDSACVSYTVHHEMGRHLPPEVKGKSFERNEEFRVRRSGRGTLIDGPRWFAAENPDYWFHLSRQARASAWAIDKVSEVGEERKSFDTLDDSHHGAMVNPASFYLGSGPFQIECLGNGGLTFGKRREGPAGTVVVAFTLEIPNELSDPKVLAAQMADVEKLPKKEHEPMRAWLRKRAKIRILHVGEMTLDPALDYCIVAAVVPEQPDCENLFERKARRVRTRAGTAVRCDSASLTSKTKSYGHTWDSWRYENYGDETTPDGEFYLSHYGFPEPLGVTPPPSPRRRWLYLGGAAVGLLVLSAVLRVVWRRRAAAKAA